MRGYMRLACEESLLVGRGDVNERCELQFFRVFFAVRPEKDWSWRSFLIFFGYFFHQGKK